LGKSGIFHRLRFASFRKGTHQAHQVIGVVFILTGNFGFAKSLGHVSTTIPCYGQDLQTGFARAARALFFRVLQRRRLHVLFQACRLESLKRAYVVHDPGSTYGCANAAEEALTAQGLTVTSGYIQDKPADADFYVEVVDRWQWDVTMFLASLDIRLVDNATGDVIAVGTFRQSSRFFHTFPDQRQTTFEVITSIYSKQPAPK
jgi:hypothetical protein